MFIYNCNLYICYTQRERKKKKTCTCIEEECCLTIVDMLNVSIFDVITVYLKKYIINLYI